METGPLLKALRTEKGYSLRELANLAHVSHSFIADIEAGRSNPSLDTLATLAKALNVTLSSMLPKDQERPTKTITTVPILGRIKAGIPILAEENWEGEVEIPSDIKADFALRISGDSMSWAGIADGDIAVLRKTDSPPNGAIVAAVIEEATWEATLKFFVRENGGAVLRAANPEYKDIPTGPKLKIIGQLVTLLKNPPTVSNYLAHLVHKDISDRKWQYAIELATQAGLDGESVANLITMFIKSVKQINK